MLDAVEKGVVPSLAPICNHPRLDPAVRRHMQQLFPQLVPPPADPAPGVDSGPGPDADLALDAGADLALDADLASDAVMDLDSIPPLDDDAAAAAAAAALPADTATTTLQPPSPPPAPPTAQPISQEELLDPVSRMFQDDAAGEGDAENASDTESNAALLALAADDDYAAVTLEGALADTSVWLFGPALSEFAANMSSPEPDVEQAARAVREIVDVFAQSDAAVAAVARVLALVFTDALEPEDIETTAALAAAGEPADSLERDLLHRLFAAAMPHLKNPAADGASRVLQLLVRLTAASADVGFRWLVYCVADAGAPQHYARYVEHHAAGSVRAALARDLAALQERFPGLFYTLLPRVYAAFPREFAGTARIVRAVVALIDQPQVYRLNALVARGHLRLFGTAPAASAIAAASIDECGVFEQVCLWQLLHAELAGSAAAVAELAEHLLLRCALDPASNSEAATGLLALLRTVPPTAALLQTLAAYAADPLPATVDDPYTRADLCGSALTAWLRAAKPALLALIPDILQTEPADDGPVRRMLVQWTATFAGGFGSTASD
ncbi:Integrator complex subunit 3, partial [Coemansia nantahalensis]